MSARFPAPILALALLFVSGIARGSPTYPQTIADNLPPDPMDPMKQYQYVGIRCHFAETNSNQPPCMICHTDPSGGVGTANQKFAQSLRAYYGLVSMNPPLLISVLDKAAAMTPVLDSDGDGDSDIDALKQCRDPNVPAGANIPPLEYGCGSIAGRPNQPTSATAALLGAWGFVLAVRRRRRVARC